MNNNTFYFFRHGETFYSKNNVPYGNDVHLAEILPEGIPAIERLGQKLATFPLDVGYSSTYHRVLQTVEIVNTHLNIRFGKDHRLDEMSVEESIEDVGKRVQAFLEDPNVLKNKHIAVCTHGAVLAAAKHLIQTGVFTPYDLPDYPKPGVLWIFNGKELQEHSFRD